MGGGGNHTETEYLPLYHHHHRAIIIKWVFIHRYYSAVVLQCHDVVLEHAIGLQFAIAGRRRGRVAGAGVVHLPRACTRTAAGRGPSDEIRPGA